MRRLDLKFAYYRDNLTDQQDLFSYTTGSAWFYANEHPYPLCGSAATYARFSHFFSSIQSRRKSAALDEYASDG